MWEWWKHNIGHGGPILNCCHYHKDLTTSSTIIIQNNEAENLQDGLPSLHLNTMWNPIPALFLVSLLCKRGQGWDNGRWVFGHDGGVYAMATSSFFEKNSVSILHAMHDMKHLMICSSNGVYYPIW